MIEVVFDVRIHLNEEDIRHRNTDEQSLRISLEDLKQYGEEVWFHRKIDLSFLPAVGMEFEMSILDLFPNDEDPSFPYVAFVVQGVKWVESDYRVYVWLTAEEGDITPRQMDQTKWLLGESAEKRWLKKPEC